MMDLRSVGYYNIFSHYLGNILDRYIVGTREGLLAHRAGRGDRVRMGSQEVVACRIADFGLLVDVEQRVAQIESAAEAVFAFFLGFQQRRRGLKNAARLVVYTASTSQFARVVVGHLAVVLAQLDATALDEHIDILGVVHHRDGQLVFFLPPALRWEILQQRHKWLTLFGRHYTTACFVSLFRS